MQPDAGESARSINARADKREWPSILAAMRLGAELVHIPKLRRAYLDRKDGNGPSNGSVSAAHVQRLEDAGVLIRVGVNRYALATGKV